MTTAQTISHREVLELADLIIDEYLPGWTFRWDTRKGAVASCDHQNRIIRFSRVYSAAIAEDVAWNTLLHEVAHALTPGHQHDAVWAAKHRELGGNGARTEGRVTADLDARINKYRIAA